MKIVTLLLVSLMFFACSQSSYLYYYGDSSHRYYKAVKQADAKSVSDYKLSLEKVFAKSAEKGLKVPPGLYCDYALLLIQENNPIDAEIYFNKEKANWPESQPMVDFIMQRYQLTQ